MARSCGITDKEKALYEWNARVQITTWGNRYCADTGGLRDYAHKEWQGLLADFYMPRWNMFFDHLRQDLLSMGTPKPDMLGTGANSNKTSDELFQMALPQDVHLDYYPMEEEWVLNRHPHAYSPQIEGNPVDVAKQAITLLKDKK
jgi:alpha-N-acetylglucosaminidase